MAKCQYKEYNRLQSEQVITGINDDGTINEILKEVATLEDTEDAPSKHVLLWAHRVEVQRAQNSALYDIKEAKESALLSTVHRSKNTWPSCGGQMQILWHGIYTEAVPCIWPKVWWMWKANSFQGSLQVDTSTAAGPVGQEDSP